MRRISCIAILGALLLFAAEAGAVRSGGHNPPTRKLEAAFKVLGGYRAQSEDGCYPSARRAAKLIEIWSNPEAGLGGLVRGGPQPGLRDRASQLLRAGVDGPEGG